MADLNSVVSNFHRLPKWVRQFGPWALVGAAIAMVGLDEFAIAIGVLAFAFAAFIIQVFDSAKAEQKRLLSAAKLSYLSVIAAMLFLIGVIFVNRKATKPWSNVGLINNSITACGNALAFLYSATPWRWVLPSVAIGCALMWLLTLVTRQRVKREPFLDRNGDSDKANQLSLSDTMRGCGDVWLHEILKTDNATIKDLVWVISIFYRRDFDKSQPRIDFIFNVFNISLVDIVISMDGGYILFSDDNEQFFFDPKFMAANPVRCRSRDATHFVIQQAVTQDEIAKRFKRTDNTRISFGNLRITFKGTEQFPDVPLTSLDVNHHLFTGESEWHNPNHPKFLSGQVSELQYVDASNGDTERLHEIAKLQLANIDQFIVSECWVIDHELIDELLFIDFHYRVSSSLVYSLKPIAIHGAVRFLNRRLVGDCTILESHLDTIEIGQVGGFTIRQPLTRNEAAAMLNESGDLYFDQTFVEFEVTSPSTRTTAKLSPQGSIENKEIRAKYPKLIVETKGTYSFISDMRDWVGTNQVLVTIKVDIENPRKQDIQIDNIRLATMLSTRNLISEARRGDIYNRQFIDSRGVVQSNGEPLKNLGKEPSLTILGRAKVSGYFQFLLEDVQVLELDEAEASLTLTDKNGEQHTQSHALSAG